MESSFTFLRVRGIPIGANWSWLLVVAIIVWSLVTALFPATYPQLDGGTYVVMAVVAALAFFASVVLHELGHALVALREGIRIDGITLWLLGGVARLAGLPPSAGAEFRVAIGGPLVSLALAVAFGAVALLGDRLAWPDAVQGVVDYLARINLAVLLFNLVPALPLDGGRVLRAWLWHRRRSFGAATRSAARIGEAFGFVLVAIGLLGLFTGPGLGGIWFAFLGWFLVQAARAEAQQAAVRQAFGGLRVADVMTPEPATVAADATVAELLRERPARSHSTYPVVDDGRWAGLLSWRAVAAVPPADQGRRRVADVMVPAAQVPTVRPDQDAYDAVASLERGGGRAVVVDDGRAVGVLSGADVVRAFEIGRAHGRAEPPARRSGPLVWIVLVLALLLAAGFLYRPSYVVISPGPTFDVAEGLSISGVPTTPIEGRYLATSVELGQTHALGTLIAALRPDREVVRLDEVVPDDTDPGDYVRSQREEFRESQRLAAAAAARAVGLPVESGGSGVRVLQVVPDSPAADRLRPGDVILSIDGREVDLAPEVGEVVRSRPVGTELAVVVERNGQVEEVVVETAQLSRVAGGVGIGVAVETRDLAVDVPFEVSFADRAVGGPSAGLAYALAIADLLAEQDYARGRTIAATGTVDVAGTVGLVGGVEQKAVGAEDAGADLFMVPVEEVDQAERPDLDVNGVATLVQALDVLRVGA